MLSNIAVDTFLSFSGGFLAFFSPCILLVLVGYFAFVLGTALSETDDKHSSLLPAIILVIVGLSAAFVMNFFPSELQRLHMKYYNASAKIAGTATFLFGLLFLHTGKIKLNFKGDKVSGHNLLISSAYLGLGFALGIAWTHCLTPILSQIISPMITSPILWMRGFFLLWAYAFGLSIPLVLSGIAINRLTKINFIKENAQEIKAVAGAILAIMGVSLFIKSWWIYLSKILIGASHNSWKNQLEQILINLLR